MNDKLGTKMIWLFGLATLAVAVLVTFLIPKIIGPISPKAMAAVYGALFGAGAAAAAFLTRASVWAVIGSSAAASLCLGIFYYIVVGRAAAQAAGALGANGNVSGAVGMMSGMIFGVIFFFTGLAGSVAGAFFGSKLRDGRSPGLLTR
jgi:hypothetical protein